MYRILVDSLDELRSFPESARRDAGFQLDRVQRGEEPQDWKPMPSIGTGVQEIRVRDEGDQYRVIYVAKLAEAIFILHCFPKKTMKTSKSDVELAARRYRKLLLELKT
ncbi:MAG: hypothetical protein B7Z78_12715 [Rhodospirillales bacterium 20-60-12]|nr:MAG: hypothetical protein B7Z78_12715 [Rhodospirillales bacterium 20-60-12]